MCEPSTSAFRHHDSRGDSGLLEVELVTDARADPAVIIAWISLFERPC